MRLAPELLEHGFTYLVLQDLDSLTKGTVVRVIEAEYHQAPKSDDAGYIVRFPDFELRLDHIADKDIIEHIGDYFEKRDSFDWPAAMAEYEANLREARQSYRDEDKAENDQRNRSAETDVAALVRQGLSPKEAYQQLLKEGKIR